MLFNSYVFIFAFLPVVLIGYFALNKAANANISKLWLFVCSLFFYSFWNINYLPLILLSIFVNFFLSSLLQEKEKDSTRKLLFYAGIGFNLGLLGFFKYADFFLYNVNFIFSTDLQYLRFLLPLGISFFTLQQVAYLVDVYEKIASKSKFIDYALFVSFFPQLIAGPIVHYSEMMPQFESKENKRFNSNSFSLGIYIFIVGLFKKVILADTFSEWANFGFAPDADLHFFHAWGTSLSYMFQLYFDFSGYSDMAIGLGHMMNIKLPENFNSPFKARNIVDFWSRWHITLTNFITTYVFTPLVRIMPKMSFGFMMLSSFLAMTVAGIWHGAGWTFVIYGMWHGAGIVCTHNIKRKKIKLPYWFSWFITFNFVNLSFIMFRATEVNHAINMYKGMLGLNGISFPKGILSIEKIKSMGMEVSHYMTNDENMNLLLIIVGIVICIKSRNSMQIMKDFEPTPKLAFKASFMFVLCIFGLNKLSEFIYFNF
ncbi:MAG: membrane-bound O-acyltransferase family protein [Peredibacter sp.]|nr:membrane-bound O-acyltransferase family protein [Peredibacter sp.]